MRHYRSSHSIRYSHEIALANAAIVAAFREGAAAAVAARYAKDAHIIPPSASFLACRNAIQRFWQSLLDLGGTDLSLVTIAVEECGPHICEIGQYKLMGRGGARRPLGMGRYLVLWRFSQGEWLIYRQIWNASA